jgi:competence protein ComEC
VVLALACPLLLDVPLSGSTAGLFTLALMLAVLSRRWVALRPALPLTLLAGLSCGSLEKNLSQRIDDYPGVHTVDGVVAGLPEWRDATLRFELLAGEGPWGASRRRLEIRWFEADRAPRPGEHWRFEVALSSVRGSVNFHGPDTERFALVRGIDGIGRVRGTATKRRDARARRWPGMPGVQAVRLGIREGLDAELKGLPGAGLVRALAIGDRSGLPDALRSSLQSTGTGHLLAISGLHVGLVAVFATGASRAVLVLFGWRGTGWPARRIAPLLGLAVATAYAGLAGFGTSPQRALIMLAVLVLTLVLRRRVGAWRGWWLALVAVVSLDPLAPLSPGLWLSFGAVAVLFLTFVGVQPVRRGLPALFRAQTVLLPGMLALSIGWFSGVSLAGWFVNLVAIPWVSVVTLPLVLLTLLTLPLGGVLHSVLAHMAQRSASALGGFLSAADEALASLWLTPADPAAPTVMMAGLGGLLCLAPGALRLRLLGAALFLPLVLPAPGLPAGMVRLEILDVGQGQATWISTANRTLLVDPGPGMPGRWSRVGSTVMPALAAQGRNRPDLVMVSHGDLDHAGGLEAVRRTWPGAPVTGNWRTAPVATTPCHHHRGWNWDGVDFRILHPSPWLPYLGNDSSCVLQLTAPGGRVLLPGDIGSRVERRLASRPATGHRLVLAPHHGSRSSSSENFLTWAAPEVVALSVGHGNRFALPHPEVMARYAQRGIPAWSTAQCGALRVLLWPDGRLEAFSARRARSGPWRYPADASCP